jgi:hypothetical protein
MGKGGAGGRGRGLRTAAEPGPAPATAPLAQLEATARPALRAALDRGTPTRLQRAAALRVDRAFARSKGAEINHVSLAEFRRHLGGTREQQDRLIHAARRAGTHSLDSFEGLVRAPTPAERAASITASDSPKGFFWISRRGAAVAGPRGKRKP